MTPPWGINWQRYHEDMQDMPHIEKMGYRSFTIYEWMWNNRDFCNELVAVARKDAIFLDRDHPLSEQKDDQWEHDPAGKGRNHADDWAQKVKDGKVFTPLDRTYFLGINEPNSNDHQRVIDTYNEAYCRRMAEHGLRAAAYSFGVGHPSTIDLDPKKPPDWHWYEASAAAVLEGHHLAAFHEYGAPTMGGYGWDFWCNRCRFCPYPFDAILDECSIDNGVTGGVLKGWAEFLEPEEYMQWLDGFQMGMAQRASTRKVNLLSYNIFSFDHGRGDKKDWHSWDIRPLRPLLEAFQWSDTPPVTIHLPEIHGPTTPLGAGIIDPFVAQAILKIESGGITHGGDGRPIIRFEAHIFKTYLKNDALWSQHFQVDSSKPWTNQMWRPSLGDTWRLVHTGKQVDEYATFEFAKSLNSDAAYNAISVGAGQIMGFNHARIGYPTAEAMYSAFQSAPMQTIGFLNYFLSDSGLVDAMRDKNWREIAKRYNGAGAVDTYAPLLEKTYNELAV